MPQAAAIAPVAPPTLAPVPTPEPDGSTAPTLESLRMQYKKEGANDVLASEKAIAKAALEPPGLQFRLSAAETMAQAASAAVVATPSEPKPTTPPPPPGAINPLTGLRVPTPELAAAFLASNPLPAGAATAGTATTPGASVSGPGTPPPVPEKIRNAPAPKGMRRKSANPESILLVVGGILAVLLGGGLTAAYLVSRDKSAAKPAQVAVDEGIDESTQSTESSVDDPAAPLPASGSQPEGAAETEPTSGTAVSEIPAAPTPETPVASVKAPGKTVVETPPPPPPVKMPDPTIQAWVQKIQLTGIRTGTVPKVFMNGKLYEAGEVVNYELNLKLTSVTGKVLHFEDAEGNIYEYRF